MKGDLIINDKDAWETWGVNMSDSFLETIATPPPTKPVIENKSSREHGKQVLTEGMLLDERDINLTISVEGDTQSQYLQRYENFLSELQKGVTIIKIPVLKKGYKVTYGNSSKLLLNIGITFGKFTVKFNEPNPNDRIIL